MSALDYQVGGDHYRDFEIQPVEFIARNRISFLPGCIIKRACRFDKPGGKGIQDLKKIKHEVDLLIELHEDELYDGLEMDACTIGAESETILNNEWRKFWNGSVDQDIGDDNG